MAVTVSIYDGKGSATAGGDPVVVTAGVDTSDLMYGGDLIAAQGAVVQYNGSLGLEVTQNGTPNLSVNVAAGVCYVPNSSWVAGTGVPRFWRVENDSSANVAVASNGSGSTRVDLIVVDVDTATFTATITTVQGTPGGGAPALGNDQVLLAEVSLPSGDTAITNDQITDRRVVNRSLAPYVSDGIVVNGNISVAVASNNLTVSLLTEAGTAPSSNNIAWVRIGGTMRSITGSLSISAPAGSNYGRAGSSDLAAQPLDWFLYAGWRSSASAVGLILSRYPGARTYSDFSGTTANDKFGIVSAAFSSSDVVVPIARVTLTLSAAASHNWSSPTNLQQTPNIRLSRVMQYTPTITGFSSLPTNAVYQFWLQEDKCYLDVNQRTNGTSNATTMTITLPFQVSNAQTNWRGTFLARMADNGAFTTAGGLFFLEANDTIGDFFKDFTGAAFTASGGKRCDGCFAAYPV